MSKYGWYRSLVIVVALALTAGCGSHSRTLPDGDGQQDVPKAVTLTVHSLYGSSASGVSYSSSSDIMIVNFTGLRAGGQFLHVDLPEGVAPDNYAWVGDDIEADPPALLTLAVPSEHGVEIGAVPLSGFSGGRLTFIASLTGTPHALSSVPAGEENTVDDLHVVPAGAGKITLTWTEHNAGDYNFDGKVDLADMRAVAEEYGESVDRESPEADETTAYWVDGKCDGSVEAGDTATILEHYGAELAGYKLRRNGQEVTAADGHAPVIARAESAVRPGLPPRYSVELAGATTDTWSVTAVGVDGTEGAGGVANPYSADLLVNVDVSGINLQDLIDDASGDDQVVKWSTRVIDPTEIVGRPTLAKPIVGTLSSFAYAALPRGKQLLLDVRYLPSVSLATGAVRTPSAARVVSSVDDAAGLQITAVPFILPDGVSTAVISASVRVEDNPAGGSYVFLATTTTIPGQPDIVCSSRLSVVDGVLTADSDANGAFDDEAQFLDDDRDQVSNQRIEQAQENEQYPDQPAPLIIQGDLLSYDQLADVITLTNISRVSGDEPVPQNGEPLRTSEDTKFGPLLWQPGDHLSVDLLRMSDPNGELPPIYWVQRAELLQPDGAAGGLLTASDNLPWEIDVSWVPVEGFASYLVERWEFYPGYGYYTSAAAAEFPINGPSSFIDFEVAPQQQYRYKYYGLNPGEDRVFLGEDVGMATADGPPGGGQFFSGILQWVSLDALAIKDIDEREQTFIIDAMTMWTVQNFPAYDRSIFAVGELVQVYAFDTGSGLYAFQVDKGSPGPPLPEPPPNM